MTEEFAGRDRNLTDYTAELVAAYVSNNHVALGDLPALIAIVQDALSALSAATMPGSTQARSEPLTDAQIRKSITPDALISFIDGKPYKSLKRHLTKHGLDPQSYRRQYGLPVDYPMVAASYSERRSEISRFISLGSRQLGRAPLNGDA
jgi:predicted transcriptional regulator